MDGTCIDGDLICNGNNDCPMNDDEAHCGTGNVRCPYGWKLYSDHCYYVVTSHELTFDDAEGECQVKGAHLTSILDMEEHTFILRLAMVVKGSLWIGLHDRNNEGNFEWTDGNPYSFSYWNYGEPNNMGDEDCTELLMHESELGLWNDVPCYSSYGFICKGPSKPACSTYEFKCKDGPCIPSSYFCDGILDCPGGEDESRCGPQACYDEEFTCANNTCIPLSWKCDGYVDCLDGEDEVACGCDNYNNEHECDDGSNCINFAFVCDGEIDCDSGVDEAHCDEFCAPYEFPCMNGGCVSMNWICDGTDDCGDYSDESEEACHHAGCGFGEFSCDNGECIPESYVCDDITDCSDGSDEYDSLCGSCGQNEFPCFSGNTMCIPSSWVCDNMDDCEDGSDEMGFGCSDACSYDQFSCTSMECVPYYTVCDGYPNCYDQSDEDAMMCGYYDEKRQLYIQEDIPWHTRLLSTSLPPTKCSNQQPSHPQPSYPTAPPQGYGHAPPHPGYGAQPYDNPGGVPGPAVYHPPPPPPPTVYR
ncbi:uncharacterized protein LOC144442001 [Glandiceps talaboti]